jgi:hypothetical protein
MKYLYLFLLAECIISCGPSRKIPKTLGDPTNAPSYGYTPIDPLPTRIYIFSGVPPSDSIIATISSGRGDSMASIFSDETIRLAIGSIDDSSNVSFGKTSFGYANHTYIIILDYIKYITKPLPIAVQYDKSDNLKITDIIFFDTKNDKVPPGAQAILPLYVGVGLRLTATIKVNKGSVNLSNILGLAASANGSQVSGTLVVQTLGISGENISPLIPMPNELNSSTIQSALISIATMKSKIYDSKTILSPKVLAFYNNIGGKGVYVPNRIISLILSNDSNNLSLSERITRYGIEVW